MLRKDGTLKTGQWEDGEILDALILRDKNWTMREIASFLGRSRNSVIGTVNRVINEGLKHERQDDPTTREKPE